MGKIDFLINNLLSKYWYLALILIVIPTSFSLLVPGYYGASDDLHIAWLSQMDKILRAGQIPPRFVPDLSYGFGYPLFNFVFPLPFYMGEAFHFLGFSFVDSIKAVFFASLFLSAFSMFFLLKEFLTKPLAIAGAVIYTYAPYRAVDLYIRGAVGEAVTFIFLPLIVLSLIKSIDSRKEKFRWVGIGAVSIGGLILSHNITAYMFLPFTFLLIALLVFFNKTDFKKISIQIFITIFLGLLISIYFWLPALVDSKLMKYDTVFNFADHFPTIKQLITPYWGYGASVPGPYDGMSFFLGLPILILTIFGTFTFFVVKKSMHNKEKVLFIWALISLFIAIFLMNYRSSFIWSNLPLLPYFQFPWRFLIITTFISPVFLIVFKRFPYGSLIASILIAVTILFSFNYFKPQDFLGRTDGYYLNKYIPVPLASEEYKKTQEEYLRLPTYTTYRTKANLPLIYPFNDSIQNLKKINDLKTEFETFSQTQETINYNKYYFPGWFVLVDNQRIDIKPGVPYGQITFNIPPGRHKILIGFEETSLKLILDIISLSSLSLALFFVLGSWKRKIVLS